MKDPSFAFSEVGLARALVLLSRYKVPQNKNKVVAAVNLPDALPEKGIGEENSLARLAPLVIGAARDLGAPDFFAHMDPPTPWITWATCLWNAALNQNLLHPDTGLAALEMETRVVSWLAPAFGMQGGHLVPGSTIANITALWAAREIRQVREVVASTAAHISIRKAAHLLGLEFRAIATDKSQRLDADTLGDLSRAVLVLTAGTTSAGAIDLLGIGQNAAWTHVDAAWAGPLRLSRRHASLLDGIENADSVAVSAHKWLFQPKESALVFFARPEEANQALSFGASYLGTPNIGLLGSRGAAAVPLLATLLAWGRSGIEQRIDACMHAAEQLAGLVEKDKRFVLFQKPTTGIVLWRPHFGEIRNHHARGSSASVTEVNGARWFRCVAANPNVEPERVFNAIASAF